MTDTRKQLSELRRQKKQELALVRQKYREKKQAVKISARTQKFPEKAQLYAEKCRIRNLRRAAEAKIPKRYSVGEEIFNSVTHGIGAGLAAAAVVLLAVRAIYHAPADSRNYYTAGFCIFGASLFILYLMSTLYHALTPYGAKKVFAVFDHSCIYILIAGTYTPFCLTVLRPGSGWIILTLIWGLTILGIVLYAVFGSRMRVFSAVSYVVMGWLIIFAFREMAANLPHVSLILLLAGGGSYTAGCIFYALKKIKWMHCIWHLFVMAGSILHFFSVYFSV